MEDFYGYEGDHFGYAHSKKNYHGRPQNNNEFFQYTKNSDYVTESSEDTSEVIAEDKKDDSEDKEK